MLKSLLIGLDGSASSVTAVELGIQWATRFDALLVGISIVDEIMTPVPEAGADEGGYYSHEVYEKLMNEARRTSNVRLDDFATRCATANVSFNLIQDAGMPYEEILRESQRYDLVVFGHETHFRFGSVDRSDETIWHVLKREARPVVIAPKTLEPGSSVVVAYNGSPQADRALQAFQASGLDLGEEVCVLSAHDDLAAAKQQAEKVAEFLRLHGINAMAHALRPTVSVSHSILEEVGRRSARMLVMGACGHSAVREFLLGSVTKAVLKGCPVPAFLCH